MTLTYTRNFNISNINEEEIWNDIIFDYEHENFEVSGCGNYNLLTKDSKNEKFIFNLISLILVVKILFWLSQVKFNGMIKNINTLSMKWNVTMIK